MSFTPWYQKQTYDRKEAPELFEAAGPCGPAIVSILDKVGRTTSGWGRDEFMTNYKAGKFSYDRQMKIIENKKYDGYAIVMRSLPLICIDIDGKNGGLEGVRALGLLPATLAEISKSGNGYHLFYQVPDSWDSQYGFNALPDVIGLQPGVDVRSTGCVYHYPQQRWNRHRPIVCLPDFLEDIILQRSIRRSESGRVITETLKGDPADIAILHDELREELLKPIRKGRRNTTLFALGCKMVTAQVPDWDASIVSRGDALGMDSEELEKIVENVRRYHTSYTQ